MDFFFEPESFSSASPERFASTGGLGGAGISGVAGKGAGAEGGGATKGEGGTPPGVDAGRGGAMGAGGAVPSAGIGVGKAGFSALLGAGGEMGDGTLSFGAPGLGMTGAPGTLSFRLGVGWGEGGAAISERFRNQAYSWQ